MQKLNLKLKIGIDNFSCVSDSNTAYIHNITIFIHSNDILGDVFNRTVNIMSLALTVAILFLKGAKKVNCKLSRFN